MMPFDPNTARRRLLLETRIRPTRRRDLVAAELTPEGEAFIAALAALLSPTRPPEATPDEAPPL